ncbi:hypothetical protein JMT66_08965 [Kosakonia cowanii]|jgi:hypothetical protein|uniref:hypothetical protein n=1 Tax=Kosakonia TaxID=1330547 RepID=UPI00190A89A8|nr:MULTISPECIES: hypothetical protein [Kosakonia]MBK0017537.1 hypothetical protein [Kosakonia sp. S42]UGS47754.1 hypothetical protein JMT66_08965 [Kosakonia cowanii]
MLYHDPRTSPGHLFYDVLEREEWQNPTGCYSLAFSVEENWRAGGQAQIIFDGDNSLAGAKARNQHKSGFNNDAYHRMEYRQ